MKRKALKYALDIVARLAVSYMAGRLIIKGQSHQKAREEERARSIQKSLRRHPAGRAS